jgi:hypothetical protein
MASKVFRNFLLILLFHVCNFSNPHGENNIPQLEKPGRPYINGSIPDWRPDLPPKKDPDLPLPEDMNEKRKEYEEKMKENLLLKQQIENKLIYIKILLITGGIMLFIIIFILFKMRCCKKEKTEKKEYIQNNSNEVKNQNNINNNDLGESGYNLIKSNMSKINDSLNISSNNYNSQNISDNTNSNIIVNKKNNLNENKIGGLINEEINDDNKTLTNNPDIFIQSKTDKMLYRPYSEEEINNSDKKN